MRRPRTLIATLAALLIPAGAHAAPPWSAPTAIQGSEDAFAGLVFAPNGTGLAGWSVGRPGGNEVFGATIDAQGRPGEARRIATGMLASHFATHLPNRVVAIGGTYGLRPRPLYAVGTVDGTLGTPRRLAGDRRGYAAGLATSPAGDFAAVLRLCPRRGTGCSRPTPHLVIRRAGRRPSKPIALARRGPVYAAAVAMNGRGNSLAVWERPLKGTGGRRGIYARVVTAGGRLRPTQRLGTSEPIPKLSVAYGHHGGAIVGWMGQRVGEAMPHSPAEVWVTSARPNRRFGSAQRVESVPQLGTGRYVGQAGVRVAIEHGGRMIAAWTGYQNGRFVVRAAGVDGGKVGEPAQVVSDPSQNTVLSDLATSPNGGAMVVGLTGIRGADPDGSRVAVGVVAAPRLPQAARFSALETIAEPGDFREGVDVEFTPAPDSRRVVVVWRDLGTRSLVTSWREPIS